jgi:hypothetical protein
MKKSQPAPPAKQNSDSESASESESDSDAGGLEEPEDPVEQLVRDAAKRNREAIKAEKEAKKQVKQELAALRRKKEINLNSALVTSAPIKQEKDINVSKLKSISGGKVSSGPKAKGSSYRRPARNK